MKIFLDTVGCRLNQAEIENMGRGFRAAGHELVGEAGQADLAVVNTCSVTSEAAADSRRAIRRISRAGVQEIIATGCWATLEPQKAAALPHVSSVVTNAAKDSLVKGRLGLTGEEPLYELEMLERIPLPGLHRRTRAFIKVQDGCDNRCTFCITTIARGKGRSRALADVILDVRSALAGGVKEIVLTGVHLGSWGQDLAGSLHLQDLVRSLLHETGIPRLRLSSLEPWDLDERFFRLWEDQRLMPHLHLPLQSGCAATLKRMARKTTPGSYRRLVAAARAARPGMAITTDIITGFPGETEHEFAASLDFVREMEFAGGHVFTYSPRPGTAAARLDGQLSLKVRKQRNHSVQQILEISAQRYREAFMGGTLDVLWESTTELGEYGWIMEGLTGNYLRVNAAASSPRWNMIDSVRLNSLHGGVIQGIIVDS